MNNQFKILCGAVALALAGPVLADTEWTVLGATPGSLGFPISSVTAVSNTGGANTTASTDNNAATQTIQLADWNASYGGIKNIDRLESGFCASTGTGGANPNGKYCDVSESTSPEHSIDNDQRYDMVMLSFTSAVKLSSVTLGWSQYDSDITVMAYTGAGTPTLVGKTYDQLGGLGGWVSIGNYSDVGSITSTAMGSSSKTINSAGVFSSYWLIGAYNPLANPTGGSVTGGWLTPGATTTDNNTVGYDYVKLASVTGCVSGTTGCTPPGQVPEPGSLAMVGLGLLGLFGMRNRRQG